MLRSTLLWLLGVLVARAESNVAKAEPLSLVAEQQQLTSDLNTLDAKALEKETLRLRHEAEEKQSELNALLREQKLGEIRAKAEVASLEEQVALAEEKEQEVSAELSAADAHVRRLRKQLSEEEKRQREGQEELFPKSDELRPRELALMATKASVEVHKHKPKPTSFLQTNSQEEAQSSLALEHKLQFTRMKLAETQRQLATLQDRREVAQLMQRGKSQRLAQEKRRLGLLEQLQRKMEAADQKRNKVLAETHDLLEDPLFADGAYGNNFVEEAPKQPKATVNPNLKALGKAEELAKIAGAEGKKIQGMINEKKQEITQMREHAEAEEKEVAELSSKTAAMEASIEHSKQLGHSDATNAALADVKRRAEELQEQENKLDAVKAQLEEAKAKAERDKKNLETERTQTEALQNEAKAKDKQLEEVKTQEKVAKAERKDLVEARRTLEEMGAESKRHSDMELKLAKEKVQLEKLEHRLQEEKRQTQDQVDEVKDKLEPGTEKLRQEADTVEATLLATRQKSGTAFSEQKDRVEKSFQAEQAKLDEQFEADKNAAKEMQTRLNYYALEPFREEVKAAADQLEAEKKQHASDDEDSNMQLQELREQLKKEMEAQKLRLKEQELKVDRMQNKYLKLRRSAEKRLKASDVKVAELLQAKSTYERSGARHVEDHKEEFTSAEEKASKAKSQLDQVQAESSQRISDLNEELEQVTSKEQSKLAKLKAADANLLKTEEDKKSPELSELTKKAEILKAALRKDEEQLEQASDYLSKEQKAAVMASEKVKALSPVMKGQAKAAEAVEKWRSSFEEDKTK
eukprot:TRINITY_DN37314_c0_g1_i1.p1 TRINITY_DN37314_c0_g1~~TRINITY_DN37314_c0_g1_i1.p1  ORF type:complete len:834 (-),score=315.84 TRINITY_DN37314_c0_g1_i1:120-2540(-)